MFMLPIRRIQSPEALVTLMGSGVALALFADLALYVVLPTHTVDAGILLVDVGLMLAANRLIRIFLNGPYGMLIERLPRRPVLLFSQCVGITAALMYVVSGFWPTLIGRFLWGIAWSGFWLAGNTAVLDVATSANRGKLVGRYHMWSYAGYVGGALFGGLLTDLIGYHATFTVFIGTGLLALVLWLLFLPETRPQTTREVSSVQKSESSPPLRVPRLPVATATVIMGLNWLIFLGIVGATLALIMRERIGDTLALGLIVIPLTTLTGFVAAGKDLLSLLAAPISGLLSDRVGNRWSIIILALGAGIIALTTVAFSSGVLVIVGLLLGAIITSVLQTQGTALMGDYGGGNRQGRLLGVISTAGDIGAATGPLLAFFLIERGWSLQNIFISAALLLCVMLPVTIWVYWRYARMTSVAAAKA
jgi:MFS family permease